MAGDKNQAGNKDLLADEDAVKIQAALNRLAKTDDGIMILRYIKWVCKFDESALYLSPDGKIDSQSMIYNEAIKFVYRSIRGALDKDSLMNVEFEK